MVPPASRAAGPASCAPSCTFGQMSCGSVSDIHSTQMQLATLYMAATYMSKMSNTIMLLGCLRKRKIGSAVSYWMGKPLNRSWQSTPSQFCRSLRTKQLNRDCFLDPQDIHNISLRLAQLTWKLHDNEAQSVRLFYQQHSEFAFIYQEERHSQPQPSVSQRSGRQSPSWEPASHSAFAVREHIQALYCTCYTTCHKHDLM